MRIDDSRILYKRKLLSQALQEIWRYPLTVVEAPMGYGKTTALRQFFTEVRAEVLWQTVFDSSEISFWNNFTRLLMKVDPVCAQSLVELGVPGDSVFSDQAVELLGSVEYFSPTVIVIDDYHLLSSKALDHFFERLVYMEITNLHIVIISRSAFGENTDELRLKGYCLLLTKRYFELSYQEIIDYSKLCGVSLKTDEAFMLQSYTEGWISVVYLCILGYQQAGHFERQSATLTELIDKVVYQPCSTETKEFLTVLSMFDSFSLAQAEHMWQTGNAGTLLTRLMAENSFITFEHVGQTYHLHNILTGFLRRIFDRQEPKQRQTLWRLAGEWYLGVGEYNAAMNYFYKAADFERLLTTIEIAKGAAFARQPKTDRIKYFQECPIPIKMRHPLAGIIYAFNLFLSHEAVLFCRQCQEVTGYIKQSPVLDERSRRQLMGEMEVLKGITAYNDLSLMAAHFKEAWRILKGPSVFIDTKTPWTLGSPSVLFLYHRTGGQLETEVQGMKELPCYYRLAGGHGFGGEYVMEAERYYYVGDFDNAEIVAHKACEAAKAKRQFALVFCAMFLLMRLALVRGDGDYIIDSMRQAREIVKQQKLYSHVHILELCEGFLFSCLNQIHRIPIWITSGKLPETLFFQSHSFFYIIYDKSLLISRQYHKLVGIAALHVAQAAIFPSVLAFVYTYIFEAAAKEKLGRRQEALATLHKALELAVLDQVVMPFVENNGDIADLLFEYKISGQYRDFVSTICRLSVPIAESSQVIVDKLNSAGCQLQLTARETEIARLVADGLSNQAIGKTLNIAKDTVKKALCNIFKKVGVSNRTELIKVLMEQGMANLTNHGRNLPQGLTTTGTASASPGDAELSTQGMRMPGDSMQREDQQKH
ncbi:MAG: LuxR C-terminal-related transcriptional regulator [Pelosinus sp.]|nr:LuxR C-terminal-related transcriptional regulator [Pelosinus sp.]